MNDRPTARWQKLTALATLAFLVAATIIWRHRVAADFWPPDASRIGPNLIASLIQAAVVLVLVVLLWPPARRAIHRYIVSHTAALHDHLDVLHAQRERHHAEQMKKLDAIHSHLKKGTP